MYMYQQEILFSLRVDQSDAALGPKVRALM